MKNSKLILSSVKFGFILLILLMNSGCTSEVLYNAKGHSVSETHYDVINQVTAAYLTPEQDLIVCLHGFYEGKPPSQKYSFRVSIQQLIESSAQFEKQVLQDFRVGEFTVPRNQVVFGCPYASNELKGWRPVKVETIPTELIGSRLKSLRPFPGTHETIYKNGETDGQVVYTSNEATLANTPVIQLRTAGVTITREEGGNPLFYLFLPVTIVVDIVAIPIIAISFMIMCATGNEYCRS